MEFVTAVLSAFLIAFFASTVATGPVTFLVFKNALIGHYRRSIAMIFGSTLMETFYCALAVFSVAILVSETGRLTLISRGLGFVITLIVGFYFILHQPRIAQSEPVVKHVSNRALAQSFVTSLFLVAANPSIILTWSAAVTALLSFEAFDISSVTNAVGFVLAAGVGTTAGSLVMVFYTHKYKKMFSQRTIEKIIKGVGVLLVFLGLYFFYGFWQLI